MISHDQKHKIKEKIINLLYYWKTFNYPTKKGTEIIIKKKNVKIKKLKKYCGINEYRYLRQVKKT